MLGDPKVTQDGVPAPFSLSDIQAFTFDSPQPLPRTHVETIRDIHNLNLGDAAGSLPSGSTTSGQWLSESMWDDEKRDIRLCGTIQKCPTFTASEQAQEDHLFTHYGLPQHKEHASYVLLFAVSSANGDPIWFEGYVS